MTCDFGTKEAERNIQIINQEGNKYVLLRIEI